VRVEAGRSRLLLRADVGQHAARVLSFVAVASMLSGEAHRCKTEQRLAIKKVNVSGSGLTSGCLQNDVLERARKGVVALIQETDLRGVRLRRRELCTAATPQCTASADAVASAKPRQTFHALAKRSLQLLDLSGRDRIIEEDEAEVAALALGARLKVRNHVLYR
jgi:hypothetical protein